MESVLVYVPDSKIMNSVARELSKRATQSFGTQLYVVRKRDVGTDSENLVLQNENDLTAKGAMMTDEQRLFAQAWLLRAAKKTRTGDKLDWDAEGYDSP